MSLTVDPITLAPIKWAPSPNYSSRRGTPITHLIWHATAGSYRSAINWLRTPTVRDRNGRVVSGPDASAHLVIREDGKEVTQLVRITDKAWHAFDYWNLRAVGVEHASPGAGFYGRAQCNQSARVFAFLCHKHGIPPVDGLHRPKGLIRHRSLGASGGNHSDGPTDATWGDFLERVHHELTRGGFRKVYTR